VPLSANAPVFCPQAAASAAIDAIEQPHDEAKSVGGGSQPVDTHVSSDCEMHLVQEEQEVSDDDSSIEEILSPQYREVQELDALQRDGFTEFANGTGFANIELANASNPFANIRSHRSRFDHDAPFGPRTWFAW
jgi:hypothetical protein